MEAECRNSLQAGSEVDFASQNCWEGLDTLKSLLPAICFHSCSSAFCCSLHPCLLLFLHIRFSDILLENPILAKVCRMNSHPIQPSRDKKKGEQFKWKPKGKLTKEIFASPVILQTLQVRDSNTWFVTQKGHRIITSVEEERMRFSVDHLAPWLPPSWWAGAEQMPSHQPAALQQGSEGATAVPFPLTSHRR